MTKNTLDLTTIKLARGSHRSEDGEYCLLEAASVRAGERKTDYPASVDPIVAAFGRRFNDLLPEDERQQLVPFIDQMIGTANDGKYDARRYLLADWAARTSLPRWLELAGKPDQAATLRALAPVTDAATHAEARKAVRAIYPDPYEARRVAWATLRSNVRDAVRAELAKGGTPVVAEVAVAAAAEAAEVAEAAEAAAVAAVAAAVAAVAAVAVVVAAAAAAEAEAVAEVAEAAEAAAAAAAAAAAFKYGTPEYWKFREDIYTQVRAKLAALDDTIPGTYAHVRKQSRQDGIDLLGRLIKGE